MPNLVPGAWVFSRTDYGCYENSKLVTQKLAPALMGPVPDVNAINRRVIQILPGP
jgi:hypothetical protein